MTRENMIDEAVRRVLVRDRDKTNVGSWYKYSIGEMARYLNPEACGFREDIRKEFSRIVAEQNG
jgi:hypothetical protein